MDNQTDIQKFVAEYGQYADLERDMRRLNRLAAHKDTSPETFTLLQPAIILLQEKIDTAYSHIKTLVDSVENKTGFIDALGGIPEMQSAHVDRFIYKLMPEEIKKMEDEGNAPVAPLETLADFTKMGLDNFQLCYPNEKISIDNEMLIDRLTPCYRSAGGYYGAMSKLSTQQQFVFHHLTEKVLRNGKATSSDIVNSTHLKNTQISAVMHMLEEKQFIVSDKTKPRKTEYTIDDKFFLSWAKMSWFSKRHHQDMTV